MTLEPTDTELVEFALTQGATREYVGNADTDRLEADYLEAWRDSCAAAYGPVAGEGVPDARTGTRLLDRYHGSAHSSGAYGDMARGDDWSTRYLANDGQVVEVNVYPVLCEDGFYGVEEQSYVYPSADSEEATDITYDWASAGVYETLEQAQAEADRCGQTDYSYAIHGKAVPA